MKAKRKSLTELEEMFNERSLFAVNRWTPQNNVRVLGKVITIQWLDTEERMTGWCYRRKGAQPYACSIIDIDGRTVDIEPKQIIAIADCTMEQATPYLKLLGKIERPENFHAVIRDPELKTNRPENR